MDVVSFCSDLIKCKSVTPANDGAIEYIDDFLASVGFETKILTFMSSDKLNVVNNLFAKFGSSKRKILGFLGHSDVVPAGDDWKVDPFSAAQSDGFLIGRGAADMKGGIAAFCCAARQFVKRRFDGTIEIFITGDEEIGSHEGIPSVIQWATENTCIPNDCLIGEPSSNLNLGDRVYLGHRGSMNVKVKSIGKQGHVAYPANYQNSLSKLCKYIAKAVDYEWKYKNTKFPRTNLEPTLLYTNNYAANVAPEKSSANLNIRFGDDYSSENIKQILSDMAKPFDLSLEFNVSGEAYYGDDANLKSLLANAIKETTGINAEFSAAGGTSDGRHMIKHCNIIEFGLQDSSIHQKNEMVKIADLENLEKIYFRFIEKYFE
jgi:succinyl-diaminopimelate desuccinylase